MDWYTYGMWNLASIVITLTTLLSSTILLHRCLTHGALKLHPAVQVVMKSNIWQVTGMDIAAWVAMHRKHHAHTDTEEDPHSPLTFGFWKVQLQTQFLFNKAKEDPELISKYARDIPHTKWDRLIFDHSRWALFQGICILWFFCWLKSGLLWGFVGAIHIALTTYFWYVIFASGCINGIGHYAVKGAYQNYTEGDHVKHSQNYHPLAWVTWGEGYHNNHHGEPRAAFFSRTAREFDPAKFVILGLEKVGLAWDVQRPKLNS